MPKPVSFVQLPDEHRDALVDALVGDQQDEDGCDEFLDGLFDIEDEEESEDA